LYFKPIKEGRKVVAFEFTMDTFNVPKDNDDSYKSNGSNDAIQVLCSLGFAERDARAIFAKCRDTADCFSRINRAEAILTRSQKPVENKLGFLRETIEKDWQVERKPNKESKRSRKVTRSKEVAKEADFLDDSMASIGQILKSTFPELVKDEQPPSKPKPIKIGKKEMPYSLAENFIRYIRKGEFLDSIRDHLKDYNVTIEKFTELCEKNGL